MLVSKSAVADYLDRRTDSHVWMKKLPKQQLLDEARRMKVRPVFQTEPWAHQLVCWWLCMTYPSFMNALTMGAGKTKIMADVFTQLLRERRARRGLVIVPRVINIDGWEVALDEHSSIEPWPINVSDIEEKRERFHNPRGELTIIDLPSLQWVLAEKSKPDKTGKKKKPRELVVNKTWVDRARQLYGDFVAIDETHKLVNRDSLWYDIIQRLCDTSAHVYGNTGTLFDRDIEDAYTQMRLVDKGATFGTNVAVFRNAFMDRTVKPWKGEIWTPSKSMAGDFSRMLQHRSINYEENELFDLPELQYIPVPLRMVGDQQDHYLRALDGLIDAGGHYGEMDGQWLRMRQIASGYLKWKDGNGEHKIVFDDNPKLDALTRLLENMGGHKLIVCHDYIDTGELICAHLAKLGIGHVWYYGGTRDKIGTKNKFLNDKRCQVLVANSEAVGTGTDGLQKVCRRMMFYESPTPPKTRRQTEKRIHRPGMGDSRPYIWDLMCRGTVDYGIRQAHKEGFDLYTEFMSGKTRGKGYLIGRA